MNAIKCHRCPHGRQISESRRVCDVDGRDIVEHSDANYCAHPEDPKFGTDAAPNGWSSISIPVLVSIEPARSIPRQQWNLAARVLAKLAHAGDRGLGDVVQRVAAAGGGELFKRYYKRIAGHDCGCADRQEKLNALYPLNPSTIAVPIAKLAL